MSTSMLECDPAPSAPAAQPPTSRTSTLVIIAFGLVYVVWGSTYLAIRVGIESFPPLLLAGSRHLLTGLILYPILRWKTGVRPTAAHWRMSFITGFLLLFLGNGAVCLAERTVPSGVTALLVATVSLWMVLVDWLRRDLAWRLGSCWDLAGWRSWWGQRTWAGRAASTLLELRFW